VRSVSHVTRLVADLTWVRDDGYVVARWMGKS
jgi:hypothetical protein